MPGLEDELGDVVRKARVGLGIEPADLARQVGMPERDLKGVEVYTKHPDETQVRRLAAALQLRADQLWELAQESWTPPEPSWKIGDDYTVDCLVDEYPENSYVITSRANESLIVDPGENPEEIVEAATRAGRRPVGMLITHYHRDHTVGIAPVQQATGVPVFVHAADAHGAADALHGSLRELPGDTDIRVGSFQVHVLHTPGHSAGSVTYVLRSGDEVAAFCGDTLFAGSTGNARFGYAAILHSVREKILALPRHATIYPGHGPATTVSNELDRNPFA